MPRQEVNITGQTFNRLTALRRVASVGGRYHGPIWLWKCVCGKEVARKKDKVIRGAAGSCGCLSADRRARTGQIAAARDELRAARAALRAAEGTLRPRETPPGMVTPSSKNGSRTQILKKFKLTVEQFNKLLEEQGGMCAICRRPPTNRALCIDHDHTTGRVRGLLCVRCNTGLGNLGDSWERLVAGIKYLTTTQQ